MLFFSTLVYFSLITDLTENPKTESQSCVLSASQAKSHRRQGVEHVSGSELALYTHFLFTSHISSRNCWLHAAVKETGLKMSIPYKSCR